ncbi:MAG: methylmalonyl Co-A mutase-associated GTPase MeaB [Elusimicrobia bacterium]|nr:methylmalonyl Co-A mutase-associated GTPase MeaB [Elusimicrobiota bacterium]
MTDPKTAARKVLAGDIRAAAALMRGLDDGQPSCRAVLKELFAGAGRAHVVGVTGPPGSGKSTLVDRLVGEAREEGRSVGVVAVDPTSPFSGGAVLGDRIRMGRHAVDPGVFIRSLATRGSLGGLSGSVFDTVTVLDAMGKDLVLIETAGVGQDGVKVASAAHTVLVVLSPGMGDDIQAIKAGVMEIGDIYVMNKADKEGVESLERSLRLALDGRPGRDGLPRPVVRTEARSGKGVADLAAALAGHRGSLLERGLWEERSRAMARAAFEELVEAGIRSSLEKKRASDKAWKSLLEGLACRRLDPYAAARAGLRRLLR